MAGRVQKPKTVSNTLSKCSVFQIRFDGIPSYPGDLVHNVYLPPFGSGYGKRLSVIGYLPDDSECLRHLSDVLNANTLVDIWFSRLDANNNVVETIRYKNSKIFSVMVDTFSNKVSSKEDKRSVYIDFSVSEASFCKPRSVAK